MDVSNCNFCYPKLRASPSYGDAMRYHAEFRDGHPAIDDIENCSDNFQRYMSDGIIQAIVDWGADSSHRKILTEYLVRACTTKGRDSVNGPTKNPVVELTVHSIGCRPAMTLLASSTSEIPLHFDTKDCTFAEMNVSWSVSPKNSKEKRICIPESLVTLKIVHPYEKNIILRRTLHISPPPIGPLQFRLQDIVWAPKLFENDEVASADVIRTIFNDFFRDRKVIDHDADVSIRRRRGFGLELETVQMPLVAPDFEAEIFTQQQQFEAAVNRAREWHLSNVSMNRDEDYATTTESINSMWDRFLLWTVSHDHYVENAAPPSRIDLYQRIRAHIMNPNQEMGLADDENADILRTLDFLVLGGGKQMPSDLLSQTPYSEITTSHASPEYQSPLPPHELYHEFPACCNGKDLADASIRLFLDGILKNPTVSTKPVIVPLISDLGQSAASIHVHVNVANPTAWPRHSIDQMNDLERTESLLCVIFGWICFDRVVQNCFCMPNVWRDKSFAPMLPTGPEFVWRELSWDHGSSVSSPNDDGTVKDVNVHNIPEWFRHVHSSYASFSCQAEKEEPTLLFETVFDRANMTNTLSRWNSLNLLPIHSYGTIEFRRMHASLDADFVSAWTWFCVGFVERFSSPVMRERFLYPFLKPGLGWKLGLQRLAEAQSNATIEDLIEVMSDESDPVLPTHVLQVLMRNHDTTNTSKS